MEHTTSSLSIVQLIRNAFMLTMAIALGLYGLIAIDAGRANYRLAIDGDENQEELNRRIERVQAIREGKSVTIPENEGWITGYGQQMLSNATDQKRAYGSNLGGALIHYAAAPKWHIWVLATHSTLGGLCMLMGALQFWPWLRRKKPDFHKKTGKLYVLFGLVSMVFAAVYLTVTPPEQIYSGLTFYVGLWLLVIMAIYSIGMAIYHIKRKEIAQHQVFMALNFGFLLTAPLLRYDWTLLGMIFPAIRQEEINLASNIFLIPQSVLFGYIFLLLNRLSEPEKKEIPELGIDKKIRQRFFIWMLFFTVLVGDAVFSVVEHFITNPGIENFSLSAALIPDYIIQHEATVLGNQSTSRLLFAVCIIAALIIAPFFFRTAFRQKEVDEGKLKLFGLIIGLGTVLGGCILFYWGWLLGLPSIALLTGGTFYTVAGLFSVSFGTLLIGATAVGKISLIKEWGLFSLACVMATPAFFTNLKILSLLSIPDYFIADGHGYLLASSAALMLFIPVFIYTAYGSATHEKIAY